MTIGFNLTDINNMHWIDSLYKESVSFVQKRGPVLVGTIVFPIGMNCAIYIGYFGQPAAVYPQVGKSLYEQTSIKAL